MGTRPAKSTTPPKGEATPPEGRKELQVDAGKIISRLQQQRADLESQVDILSVALEESQEREQHMLARIAELEEK